MLCTTADRSSSVVPVALAAYPMLPWIGVAARATAWGDSSPPPAKRDRTLLLLGVAMLALFVVLRGFNAYGNPAADVAGGPFGGGVSGAKPGGARSCVSSTSRNIRRRCSSYW